MVNNVATTKFTFFFFKYTFSDVKIIGCDHTSTIFSKGLLIDKIKYLLLKKLNYVVALTKRKINCFTKDMV